MIIIKQRIKKNDIVKYLTLIFEFNGKNINIQCKSNEEMQSVFKKFCAKAVIEAESYIFICKGEKLINDLTIDENRISDKEKILVAAKINEISDYNKKEETQMKNYSEIPLNHPTIQLSFQLEGRIILIQVSKDTRFSEAVEKFLMKTAIGIENKRYMIFISNSKKIDNNEDRTKEEIFGENKNNIRIDAFNQSNVIGA